MRFITSLFALLLSFTGAVTMRSQLQVSYNATASVSGTSLENGYYVIKAKFKNSPEGWLLMNNSQGKFSTEASATTLSNVWKVERSENGSTFCMKNALSGSYLKYRNNSDFQAITDKSQATYFTALTDFTMNAGVSKLDDNAFALYVGDAVASGQPQFVHVNGVSGDGSSNSVTSFTLSTFQTNIENPNIGGSTVGQFVFYKVNVTGGVVPAVSAKCTYYLQNANGNYLTCNSGSNGAYISSKDEARTYYLKRRTDGNIEIYSNSNKLTYSPKLWFVPETQVGPANQDSWRFEKVDNLQAFAVYNLNRHYLQGGVENALVSVSDVVGSGTWFFVPANEASKLAEALTIKINAGDNIHGNVATFSASYPVELPSGYSAYYATYNAESNYVQMNEIESNVIPENTGVIVKGEEKESLEMKPSLAVATAINAENKLVSVGDNNYTFTNEDANVYLLGKTKSNEEISFIRLNTEGTQTIGAHKAYLSLSGFSTETLSALQMRFDGVIEDVNTIVKNEDENADAPYYDLSGRRVLRPQHGIYIRGGKKVVIK